MFVKEDKNTKQQLFSTLKKNDKFSVTEEHRNKLHFKTYYNRNHFNYNDTSQYSCIFDQTNAALVSIKHFFQKHEFFHTFDQQYK